MPEKWLSMLNNNPIGWLIESNPWTKYRTLIDLLEEHNSSKKLLEVKEELLCHPLIIDLIKETKEWFYIPLKRHDDSTSSHYKLKMLADFGFDITNNDIKQIVTNLKQHNESDLFAIKQALPEKGKFSVKVDDDFDEWHALPCDSTLLSAILLQLGDQSDEVLKSIELIKNKWQEKSGWFCHLFFVEGQFKKHKAGCQMAALQALEVFSLLPDKIDDKIINNAYEALKFHKDFGKSLYYFGRSKKFWTFKYPFVWYNALYIAEVLTRFDSLKNTNFVKEIVEWIVDSQDENGRFKPTSMFRSYSKWDFSNKKEASPWITYLCCKILKRYYR